MVTRKKKNEKGYYEIRRKVPAYKTKSGKIENYKKFYGKTLKEAEAKYQAYVGQNDSNEVLFFGDLIDLFIENTFLPDSKYKDSTKQRYVAAYRNVFKDSPLLQRRISEITFWDLQSVYTSTQYKPSSVNSCHKLLRLFYSLMVKQGFIDHDPTEGLTVPKPKKRNETIETFTDDEISRLEAYLSRTDLSYYQSRRVQRARFFIIVAIYTGMRTSEILALKYDDFFADSVSVYKQIILRPVFENGEIVDHYLDVDETKSACSIRTIPVEAKVTAELRKHKQWHEDEMVQNKYHTDYVFTTSSGKFYDKRSFRHMTDKIQRDAGLRECGLHVYRRTFGTRLARAGTPITVLSKLMGHSDVSVTAKYYIGVSDDEKSNAVSVLYKE